MAQGQPTSSCVEPAFGHDRRILFRFADLVRWLLLVGVLLPLVLLGTRNAKAFPSSRLVYVRGLGAESCPDRNSVREAVKKRLGYDPFFPNSDKTIIARVVRDATKLHGEVELVDERGTQVGKRVFAAPLDQCDQLVHAMALSISIAIDPKSAETYAQGPADAPGPDLPVNQGNSQPVSESDPVPKRAIESRALPITPQPSPSVATASWLWLGGFGPTLQFRSLPQPALGASVFGALRRNARSMALEAELDSPVTSQERGVQLRSTSFALKLVPCGHWQLAFACQVTALRWLAATGSASGLGGRAPSLALGARLGLELPLSLSFSALAYGDLMVTAVPVRLVSETRELWEMPLLSGGLGIAAVVHFR